jgi:hypothetical protein
MAVSPQGVGTNFVAPNASEVSTATLQQLRSSILDFCAAVTADEMSQCKLPAIKTQAQELPPPAAEVAAAAAATTALLDEDDALVYEVEPFGEWVQRLGEGAEEVNHCEVIAVCCELVTGVLRSARASVLRI